MTLIYRPDDFSPGHISATLERISSIYRPFADDVGLSFRCIPIDELIPACTDRPHLWWKGEDLLDTRQCYQVDEFSWDPQTAHYLHAVYRTVEQSDSVLLGRTFEGPTHVVTDKLSIIQRAAKLDIRTPATVAIPFGRYARTVVPVIEKELGPGPYIVKPRELGMGFGILKVDTIEQLNAAIDMVAQSGMGYLAQQFLPNTGDLRVYVIDGEVVAGQQRVPEQGNYIANISQGGSGVGGKVQPDIAESSRLIAADLKASCLSVDWLLSDSGPVLIEWCAGLGGFSGLPEPDRARVGTAFFRWARSLLN
ncbi:hypothetical protein ABTX61_25005 [Amycolatopsis japonica]|uniref:ATP-grasp domain-containing protein n=1 Tax=Amycolatopsis japonica TaxID=208439 RepID=UPI00331D6778